MASVAGGSYHFTQKQRSRCKSMQVGQGKVLFHFSPSSKHLRPRVISCFPERVYPGELTINSLNTKHHLGLLTHLQDLNLTLVTKTQLHSQTAKLDSIFQHSSSESEEKSVSVEKYSKATCVTRMERQGELSFYCSSL